MEIQNILVEELAFISDRLRRVFEQNSNDAAYYISSREVAQFQNRLGQWTRDLLGAPKPLVAACNLEGLTDFYQRRLDFSIFQDFESEDFATIQEEIAAYVAREAIDRQIGYRVRNWAAIGLQTRIWPIYQKRVRTYYEQSVPKQKQIQITNLENRLTQSTKLTLEAIRAKCIGNMFFEVDKIRLMPRHVFNRYLEQLGIQEIESHTHRRPKTNRPSIPQYLHDSFQFFGFTHPIDINTLKESYRELALSYHPDKGGSLQMMQKLNASYQQIADYLSQSKVRGEG